MTYNIMQCRWKKLSCIDNARRITKPTKASPSQQSCICLFAFFYNCAVSNRERKRRHCAAEWKSVWMEMHINSFSINSHYSNDSNLQANACSWHASMVSNFHFLIVSKSFVARVFFQQLSIIFRTDEYSFESHRSWKVVLRVIAPNGEARWVLAGI